MEHYTDSANVAIRTNYFKPIWRWLIDVQNDFAARADWCIKDYASANHHPIIRLKSSTTDIKAKIGKKSCLMHLIAKTQTGIALLTIGGRILNQALTMGLFLLIPIKRK